MPKVFPVQLGEFTDSPSYTASDKLRLTKQFWSFFQNGFPAQAFSKPMYRAISNMFMHIAEYDKFGFYETWFATPDAQAEFVANMYQSTSYGALADLESALRNCAEHLDLPGSR